LAARVTKAIFSAAECLTSKAPVRGGLWAVGHTHRRHRAHPQVHTALAVRYVVITPRSAVRRNVGHQVQLLAVVASHLAAHHLGLAPVLWVPAGVF
jgi:hypothetical protein